MSSTTANTISVHCPCGKKLKAPATAVGRKAKCPNCGNVMTVTAPLPPPPSSVGVEENDPLYDLAHAAPPAPPAPPPVQQQAVCPSCHSPMTAGAILCTSCGYDTRSGQKLSTTLAAASAGTPPASMPLPGRMPFKPKQPAADDGTRAAYIRGTIISGIAALIGAFIWFGVAKATEREIGWIAWGVGVMAGFGMMIGANGNSPTAGMIAAAMSVGGILLGKFMVFTFVVMPMFGQLLDKTLGGISDMDKLEVWVTNQQLEKKKLDIETASDAQRAAANAEATKLIAKMDAKSKAAETKKAQENFSRLMGEAAEEIPKSRLFFSTMFGPLDVLFFILAIASAFKVATFSGESDD
jgi:hypothetical protein